MHNCIVVLKGAGVKYEKINCFIIDFNASVSLLFNSFGRYRRYTCPTGYKSYCGWRRNFFKGQQW